uniref:F-box domain-containing protein n=1 Tax=Elaeophora elaphi TaxID=1147741 RepID=A0A0R3S7C8_9BILA
MPDVLSPKRALTVPYSNQAKITLSSLFHLDVLVVVQLLLMALTLPLHVVASVQRCCSNRAGTSSLPDEIVELIVNRSSLFDVIKWQQISKSFQRAAQKRLDLYTMIDIKVYNDLRQFRHKAGIECMFFHLSYFIR